MMMSSKASLTPPAEPINFSNKFFIPEMTGKMLLEELNPHPLDSKITFESAAHKYYYDGVPMDRSVTEVVGSFFEKFDADLVARRMIAGNNFFFSNIIIELHPNLYNFGDKTMIIKNIELMGFSLKENIEEVYAFLKS